MRNPVRPMAHRSPQTPEEQDLSYQYKRRIGRLLQERREEAGMTQVEVAKLLGVTGNAISSWESGQGSLPPERFEYLAELFEIPKADFGKFLLRYSNPWIYALIYGHRSAELKADLDMIPERVGRLRQPPKRA